MRAIISGSGMAGLTVAWWLCRYGWDVVIVERHAGPRLQGYMIDFFGPGYAVAEQMQLLNKLRQVAQQVKGVAWLDETGKEVAVTGYEQFLSVLGGKMMSLMRGDLESVLLKDLPVQATIKFGCTVESVLTHFDQVKVRLSTGEELSADLLIGADGVHSGVRRLVFGNEEQFLRYLGYHTAAFLFHDPAIAAQLDNDFNLLTAPGKQVGLYAIGEGKVACFFMHSERNRQLPDDPIQELKRAYSGLGWLVPEVLSQSEKAGAIFYDQVAQIEMTAWSKGRVVLVGDACQAVSLLAGQGASLAMYGAFLLAECLNTQSTVESAIQSYEHKLHPIIRRKQASGRRTASWLAPSSRTQLFFRNQILRVAASPGFEFLLAQLFGLKH